MMEKLTTAFSGEVSPQREQGLVPGLTTCSWRPIVEKYQYAREKLRKCCQKKPK